MDIQKLMDAIAGASRSERSNYHLTLGDAIKAFKAFPPDAVVVADNGEIPGDVESYRGYYSDLSFQPSKTTKTAAVVLSDLESALGNTFEGYKGGDFVMGENTPLWLSAYGTASGVAITAASLVGEKVVLSTRETN